MPSWHLKDYKGAYHPAELHLLTLVEARSLRQMDWEQEFDWSVYTLKSFSSRPYKLLAIGNAYIQGAIAYRDAEGYVFVDLLESAPANRYANKQRAYVNVVDILLGAACERSREIGGGGLISFKSKTNLVRYYIERFGAELISSNQMVIDENGADRLFQLYYR
ncbi:hypothetical protein [Saccharibacillus kuerlensis]|uniref:N-acetyltransferase domain-containing protein n=1 Tax=Saccharibacillus kuerlensis TaxID=459527 RepID=A0ABQ2L0E0_9BACL|nr:hypothetical protein [Saccharibacillus kuerlensis]GGN98516.1 hypothetical protein GCM10010969_17740 [Saccharibacillus kuerlensis]